MRAVCAKLNVDYPTVTSCTKCPFGDTKKVKFQHSRKFWSTFLLENYQHYWISISKFDWPKFVFTFKEEYHMCLIILGSFIGKPRIQIRIQSRRPQDERLQEQGRAPRRIQSQGIVQLAGTRPQNHSCRWLHFRQEAGLRREGLLQETRIVSRIIVDVDVLHVVLKCWVCLLKFIKFNVDNAGSFLLWPQVSQRLWIVWFVMFYYEYEI